jgi:transketolase
LEKSMNRDTPQLDLLCVNTIRTLSMDAVQKASSGHPGTPMGLAPVAYCLWQRILRYDPADPRWPNRDRFVLSNGHASMLLYSLLHLASVRDVGPGGNVLGRAAVTLDDIKSFRQLGSRCPGHPEYGVTGGVETTTGPLGQGAGNSVGMAIAGRWMKERFNRPGFELFDFDVYALVGDGDMMEGVTAESASLAGHLGLSNLCWAYDRNRVTIEGGTDLAFSEDVPERFRAYGWRVERVPDANDLDALEAAFNAFRATVDRPTLIVVDGHIAYGSPNKVDSSAAHGEPLGEEEVRLTKRAYGWDENAQFLVPDGVRERFAAEMGARGGRLRAEWSECLRRYREDFPEEAAQLGLIAQGELPDGWDADLPTFKPDPKGIASRTASGQVLNRVADRVPWLLGGSADLAPSNKTRIDIDGAGDLGPTEPGGRNLHFGVREHSMGAVLNGLSLCGLRPYGGTFLVFSDYMRPAIRLAALMKRPVIYLFTHDSVSVGEDGPTHQPVEQLASLRAMPGLVVVRPADANEVVGAWRVAMRMRDRPCALVLSRQALPTLDRSRFHPPQVERGAYVLADASSPPEVVLIGTGSEVSLCVDAWERLASAGVAARVVSMPSTELFEQQSDEYRESVLPAAVMARVVVEQGSGFGWERYAGDSGEIISIESFGVSAPGGDVRRHFGFTVERVVDAASSQIGKRP